MATETISDDYIVNISKPPIRPPLTTVRYGLFGGGVETRESRERGAAWQRYIGEFGEALRAASPDPDAAQPNL
jgi:hypothetical protein